MVGLTQSPMESDGDRSYSVVSFSEEDDDDETLDIKPIIKAYNESKIIPADEVPLAEMCFEIESDLMDDTIDCLKGIDKVSRFDQLISPIPPSKEDDDLNENVLISSKSPLNTTFSDCGYSSQGSPISIHEHDFGVHNDINDDFNFLELFPQLA